MLDANLLLKMAHCSNLSLAHFSRILEFLKQLFSQALAAHRRSHILQLSVAMPASRAPSMPDCSMPALQASNSALRAAACAANTLSTQHIAIA